MTDNDDEVTFRDVLREACDPIEEDMGEDKAEECQVLIMELGHGDMGKEEFEESVDKQLGSGAFDKMANALTLFD